MSGLDSVFGRFTVEERILGALLPLLVVLCFLSIAAAVYYVRRRTYGRFLDEEMGARGLGGLTSESVRHFFAWLMRPVWQFLAFAHVAPNAITVLSLAVAAGAGVAAAFGRFALAGWLFLAA